MPEGLDLPLGVASPPEVLELKPNRAADATSGPHPQFSQTVYVTWTKPNGMSFIAPLSNSETYERKAFSKGAEQDIPDFAAYLAELAKQEPKVMTQPGPQPPEPEPMPPPEPRPPEPVPPPEPVAGPSGG
jgi:hypothetical protein